MFGLPVSVPTLCVRAESVLVRLSICTGSSVLLLFAYAMSTKILCTCFKNGYKCFKTQLGNDKGLPVVFCM